MICSSDPLIAGASRVSAEVDDAARALRAVAAGAEQADPAGEEHGGRERRRPTDPNHPSHRASLLVALSWERGPARRAGPRVPIYVDQSFDQLCGVAFDPEAGYATYGNAPRNGTSFALTPSPIVSASAW